MIDFLVRATTVSIRYRYEGFQPRHLPTTSLAFSGGHGTKLAAALSMSTEAICDKLRARGVQFDPASSKVSGDEHASHRLENPSISLAFLDSSSIMLVADFAVEIRHVLRWSFLLSASECVSFCPRVC